MKKTTKRTSVPGGIVTRSKLPPPRTLSTTSVTRPAAAHGPNWVRLNNPTPRSFPVICSVGLTEAVIISVIRVLFSPMTPIAIMFPYMMSVI